MLLGLKHHPAQFIVHFNNLMGRFAPLAQLLSPWTLALQLLMRLIPHTNALIAELALADTLHMRATNLLLDRLSAFGALSRVVFEPTRVDFFRVE
jgi:hypothetical protein